MRRVGQVIGLKPDQIEAYERLRQLYDAGKNERLPTLITRLKFLEQKLNIPNEQRIPENAH